MHPSKKGAFFMQTITRGIEKEWSSAKLVWSQQARRQKQSSGLFLRRGSPIPITGSKNLVKLTVVRVARFFIFFILPQAFAF